MILRLVFAGAAIFIGLLLGIAILTSKKTNKQVNLLLLVLIVYFIGLTMDSFLMYTGLYNRTPHFVLAVAPFGFLIGAVYYFYIRIVLEPSFKFRWYDGIHLILMIRFCYYMRWLYLKSSIEKVETLKFLWFDNPNKPTLFQFIEWSQDEFLTVFYLIATIRLINLALKTLKSKSSNTDIEYLSWLKKSTYIFLVLMLLGILRIFLVIQYDLRTVNSEILSSIMLLMFAIYLIFQMIQNPDRAFYKLNAEVTITNKENFNFSVRLDLFLKNIARLFTKKKDFNRNILLFITGIILIGCIYFYFFNPIIFKQSNWYYFITVMLLFFMTYQFTIIDNHIIYQDFKTVNRDFVTLESTTKNNLNSEISKNNTSFILSLKEIMKNERPHLNPNLKSHDIANLLDTTAHDLSKKINQELGQNFYSFINSYRIEEFKKRVLQEENKNFTLTSIATDAGFNSKSSFNRIFKAVVGTTPSEYIKTKKKVSTFKNDTPNA